MTLRKDVLHSLKWLAGARFAGQLVTWAITLVVIRILKPTDYGVMAIAEVLIGFAALFQEMGMFSAMVQKRGLTDRQVEQAFGLLIVVNSTIYVLLFAFAPLLAQFFGDARLTSIVRVLGIQFPLASVGVVQDAMLSRAMRFKERSLASLSTSLANGFTTLSFALTGAGVWALVFGSLAGAMIRPISLSIAAKHWCWPRFSRDEMTEMLRFGGFVTATKLLWYVYSRSDVFIIGKILGNELLGFYSIAMQLASLPMQKVSEFLNQVGFAAYSSIQHDMTAISSHYLKALRIASFVSFPVFWGISGIAPELVDVVLGKRWEAAVVPLQLLGLAMPIRMIGHAGSSVLSAIGKPQIDAFTMLLALLVMPPAFFAGAWYGGLAGAAMAWVIGYPILTLIRLRISLQPIGLNIRTYLAAIAGPAAAGAAMYVVVLAMHAALDGRLSPVGGIALMMGVGALVYAAVMWLHWRGSCMEVLDLLGRGKYA